MRRVERPLFVIGVDHSGTSILYRLLARHPDLAWLTPFSQRGGDFPGRARVPFHAWINRTGRRVLGVRWRKGAGRLLPQPREGVGIWRRLIPRTGEILHASDCTEDMAAAVRAALAAELEAWRLDRMLVKVPYLTRALEVLDHIFGDALFVHIVRDGRAVALSTRRLFAGRARDATDALRAAALNWVETLEHVRGLEDRLGGRLTTIHYEDFCGDVHGHLVETLRFAGLDPARVDLRRVPSALRPTNERWLTSCPPGEQRLLNHLLVPALRRWGYEAFEPLPRPASRAPRAEGARGMPGAAAEPRRRAHRLRDGTTSPSTSA